ncbi:HAMP domain-containing sensor histidine kinase [Janthinobacterium sp.]|uniref:sensor histidine kinase n=1 Tax=Janthinobacterium sp. TaxID=1871054 RepID=UPI00293D85B1|nr:HAMP domain-containing sensor histidine kinase [Janthinobacterium sp.]
MEQRILIYTPTGRDGPLAARVLRLAGLHCEVCGTADELARQLALGAAGVLTAEEALAAGAGPALRAHIAAQASWSDLPVLLLNGRGSDAQLLGEAVGTLGNLTLLERPVRALTLVAAAHALLRARNRQYQVREAERRKDEFIASLGHELRNPLTPIKSSAELLGQLYPDAPGVTRIRAIIERQVGHLTRLVDDLLDVARISNGKIGLRRATIRLSDVIEHVRELCQRAASEKGIALTFSLPARDVAFCADQARVVQMLANIVGNAIKFTPAGGHVALAAALDGAFLRVSVRDDGVGLEAEAIPRIFGMFEQGRNLAGPASDGLGIGLSLARQFAELHGGSVRARSGGAGKGSEFIVRLPLAAPAAPG